MSSVIGTVFAPARGMKTLLRSAASGVAGAVALTSLHELARRRIRYAPRMDVVAMRGLVRAVPPLRQRRVRSATLHRLALAGDLLSNSLYYAAVPAGSPRGSATRAVGLGLAAGVGALLLPQPMGLGTPPSSHIRRNQVMTVIWYVTGAMVAAAVATLLGGRSETAARPRALQA